MPPTLSNPQLGAGTLGLSSKPGNLKSSTPVIGLKSYQSYLSSSHALLLSNNDAQVLDSSICGQPQRTSAGRLDTAVFQRLQSSPDIQRKKKEMILKKKRAASKKSKTPVLSASKCSNVLLKTIDSSLVVTSPGLKKTSPGLVKASPGLMTASPRQTKLTPGLMQMDKGLTKTSSSLLTCQSALLNSFPQMKSATPTLGVTTPCRYSTPVTTSKLKSLSSPAGLENKLLLSTTGSGLRSSALSSPLSLLTQTPAGHGPSPSLTKDSNLLKYTSTTGTKGWDMTEDNRWIKPGVKIQKTASSVTQKLKKWEKTEKRSSAPVGSKKMNSPEKAHLKEGSRDKDIGAPKYEMFIKLSEDKAVQMPAFSPSTSVPIPVLDTSSKKMALLNAISSSLICSPNFKDVKDESRAQLMALAENIALYDPEFVLKTALYTRRELNIRTPANFLLALASNVHPCRTFLKKYFKAAICLPSDWIDVAELYQAFYDKSINYGSLPAALRRVMVTKFPDFDKYQLAKYNKDKSKSKKVKIAKDKRPFDKTKLKEISEAESSSDEEGETEDNSGRLNRVVSTGEESETEEELAQRTFTLKQLIRKLHITEPVEHVMCLIGKKYPESLEEFYKSRLPGTWEEERCGKRMKLPIPQTWETQVSLKGNKASTWEELIDIKKLPFMAMLRNLRNMIKAGISPKHHNWVIRKLSDQGAVIYSKQFPFRFFSAYEILDQLEADYHKNQEDIVKQAVEAKTGDGRRTCQPRQKLKKSEDGSVKWWLKKKGKKKDGAISEVPFDLKLLGRYRKALDTAVKIATVYNVQPIKGRTLILCDVGSQMELPCTAARGLGKPRQLKEVGLLLGLMCKYSCEECTLILYDDNNFTSIDVAKGTILDNMNIIKQLDLDKQDSAEKTEFGFPKKKLMEILRDRVQVDNLINLWSGIDDSGDKGRLLDDFLSKYRRIVYPDLLFVSVALAGKFARVAGHSSHPNNIHVSGYSDQILRFVAERGSGAQLTHVENIDTAYNLDSVQISHPERLLASPPTNRRIEATKTVNANPVPVWRTVRVFISSTFRDMHGERDILTRFIFPELRARAKKHFINIIDIDLRWGVTEEESKNRQSVEICLREVFKCQFFIGLLGERQGWVPLNFDLPDDPEFDWLKDHPQGASLTELEMYAGALRNPKQAKGHAFFYVRNNSFISDVPESYRSDFESENSVSKNRMDELKETVRQSGLCSDKSYPCSWQGVVDGKPFTGNLSAFGWKVLNDLWGSILMLYPDEEITQDEEQRINKLHQAALAMHTAKFVGRKSQVKQCLSKMADNQSGVLILTGKSGTGKSALLAAVHEEYKSLVCQDPDSVLEHVVGSAPGSTSLTPTLRRLCTELQHRFSLPTDVPQEYKNLVPKFNDVLKECGKRSAGPVVVFIDGIDSMDDSHQPSNMEWLPQPIPQNVLFVLTCLEHGRCHRALEKHRVAEVNVGSLDLLDKAKVVRSTLAMHRKSLEESAFNNQMKILLSKREASNPLYLTLACEELRLYSVFEKITGKLRSLPHTVSQLLGDILSRMETDVGKGLTRTSLCLLVTSRTGLGETELHDLLSLHREMEKYDCSVEELAKTELPASKLLPAATFLRLQRALHAFLRPLDSANQTFCLAHMGMEQAVRQRYMSHDSDEVQRQLHKLLSGYFWHVADPKADSTWQGGDGKAFSELPYHLMCSGHFQELETILCDLTFLEMKCRQGQITQLIEDFSIRDSWRKSSKKNQQNFLEKKKVKEYKYFVSRHAHILARHPGLTLQQALNDYTDSQPALDAERLLKARPAGQNSGTIRWNNRPLTPDQCMLTIADLPSAVLCVAVSPCERILACGDADCMVKLYDTTSGKELRTFHGHSNKLTDLCFVNELRLVSSSKDKMMFLWDVASGQRVSTLKGHGRSVNSCDSNGSLIASAGWDCNVKVWAVKDGKEVCEFKDIKPINCVSFHPEDESVVTGGWDSTLKIWDIFNRRRKAILRGHKSSVREARFSPSGRYIASAALDGEVKLWSALNGAQLGDIQGHSLPINKLVFTPSGKELVTVSDDQKVKVWSAHLGKLLHSLEDEVIPVSVALSPDGTSVAVGYHSGQVRVFDVESGLLNYEIAAHADPVRCITYTISGENIITGSEDSTSKVFESGTGNELYKLMGHSKPVLCVTAGKTLLSSTSEDFTCCLFRYQTPYKLKITENKSVSPIEVLTGHIAPVTSCSFNPSETRLATASRDMSVRIWDMTTIDLDLTDIEPIKILHACHADWITDCKWSNIGDFLITSSNDFNVKVWDINAEKERTSLIGHSSTINGLAYKYGCVVTASSDGTAKVWSHKGTEITTLYGHQGRVLACDMLVKVTKEEEEKESEPSWGDQVEELEKSKKEKAPPVSFEEVVVVTCDDIGSIKLWKPLQANEVTCLTGHSDRVVSLDCFKSGTICTSSLDKSVKLWAGQVRSGDVIGQHNGEVTCVASSWDEALVATGSRDGCLKVWVKGQTEEASQSFRLAVSVQAHGKSLNAICFVREDSLATGSDDGTINLWRILRRGNVCLRRMLLELRTDSPISCLAHHAVGSLVSGEWTGEVKVWHLDLDNDKLLACNSSKVGSVPGHGDWVTSMKCHNQYSSYLFSVGADGKLGLWHLNTRSKMQQFWSSQIIFHVYNGEQHYGGRKPSRAQRLEWKPKTIRRLLADLPMYSRIGSKDNQLKIFPECQALATVESNSKACLSDVGVCGKECFVGNSEGYLSKWVQSTHQQGLPVTVELFNTNKVHDGAISAVVVTKHLVFTASLDSTIKVWTHDGTQVGQFCCPSPVTCLRSSSQSVKKVGDSHGLICGDKLGNVYFLTWTM
ncbi:LOW QUALITY PROTEIN: telomerase protein component 1-like [Liolophura sinensis]|uniref:LOW QUALITY PROTEIN: telomerase protein component 1-like n=1 Tax=Liolophura sinensis TaxID=3198878 RepID=UPI003158BBFD